MCHAGVCTEPSQCLQCSRSSLLSLLSGCRHCSSTKSAMENCSLPPADVVIAPAWHPQGDRAVQRGQFPPPAPGQAPLEPAVLATVTDVDQTCSKPAFAGTQPFCLFSILKAQLITIFVSILISHVHIKAQLMFSLTSQAAVWMPKISKLSWRETRIKEKTT